jgi:hypothetical protein
MLKSALRSIGVYQGAKVSGFPLRYRVFRLNFEEL